MSSLMPNTNYAPIDEEASQVRAALVSIEERLGTLTIATDVAHARSMFDILCARYKGAALPDRFDNLPIDVIQEIFALCLPTTHYPVISLDQAPLLLTRVSKGWRDLAINTPALWSSIHIPVPTPVEGHDAGYTDRQFHGAILDWLLATSRLWLERTSAHPLRISYFQPGFTSAHSTGFLSKDLVSLASRLKCLTVVASSDQMRLVASLAAEDVPVLERLVLVQHDKTASPFWTESTLLAGPRIRHLDLKICADVNKLRVNWRQLTNLSLRGIGTAGASVTPVLTLSQIMRILLSCSSLVSCSIAVHSSDQEDTFQAPLISLPCLQTLDICVHNVNLLQFFEVLHVPSLKAIGFFSSATMSSTDPPSIISFLRQGGSGILSLSTDLVNISKDDFIDILHSCPSLTSLSVKTFRGEAEDALSTFALAAGMAQRPSININNDFLRLLSSPTDTGEILAPSLTDLELLKSVRFTDEEFLAFVRTKQTSGGMISIQKLKYVSVRFFRSQMIPMAAELKRFEEEGLKLDIWYPYIRKEPLFIPTEGLTGVHGLPRKRKQAKLF